MATTRSLDAYDDKRDFAATPEPKGRRSRARSRQPRFVVQEHSATAMHWDLRLEHEGVLLSWAVPKGVPLEPKVNRLAMRTEDHPLEYLDFEGEIPEGSYGAGTMTIWDHGTFELEEIAIDADAATGKVHVRLEGQRVQGRYMLVLTKTVKGREQWILRRLDPAADPDRAAMPQHVKPMLAKLADLPDDQQEWAFEVKWDGIRAVVFADGGRIRIETRNQNDVTQQYPELTRFGRALGSHQAIIDGEIVAFDEHGKPSFQTLQSRLGLSATATIKARSETTPVRYLAFDLLHLDGFDTRPLPYLERRALLRELFGDDAFWQVPDHHVGTGTALLDAVVEQGLEGVMAKRVDSPYRENSRAGAWRKIKRQQRQEFVVCGWTDGDGRRAGSIGALILGHYDVTAKQAKRAQKPQRLVHAGSVGTGFGDQALARLHELLLPLEIDHSPFDVGSPATMAGKWKNIRARSDALAKGEDPKTAKATRGAIHYAQPRLVCEIEYTEFTRDGTLRHPSFKGLRDDKDARDVIRE